MGGGATLPTLASPAPSRAAGPAANAEARGTWTLGTLSGSVANILPFLLHTNTSRPSPLASPPAPSAPRALLRAPPQTPRSRASGGLAPRRRGKGERLHKEPNSQVGRSSAPTAFPSYPAPVGRVCGPHKQVSAAAAGDVARPSWLPGVSVRARREHPARSRAPPPGSPPTFLPAPLGARRLCLHTPARCRQGCYQEVPVRVPRALPGVWLRMRGALGGGVREPPPPLSRPCMASFPWSPRPHVLAFCGRRPSPTGAPSPP